MSRAIKIFFYTPLALSLLCGCSGLEDSEKQKIRQMNATGEQIYRAHNEYFFTADPPKKHIRKSYRFEEAYVGSQIKITKEFFRCRGGSHNSPITKSLNGGDCYVFDCGGWQQHSLPLKDGKEFIYPALLDLLNYLQEKTKKKVQITCGHRCPTHNTYSDSTQFNRTSKHMIGAEVDFYIIGLEWTPEVVIDLLHEYYKEHSRFQADARFNTFHRFEKETNVTTLPWYNKEIFVKIFKKDEGRDLDNDHRFPYISIQLKWDRDREETVTYSWPKAFNGYLRY